MALRPQPQVRAKRPTVRIVHTSDWHLGISTGHVSRLRDQERFLEWLTALLAERAVDALVVAGDVFDTAQPSSEALALYFRFLAGIRSTGVRNVVVVGGNHDSPARLDAPRDVLAGLDVHVVGGLWRAPGDARDLDAMIVPLRTRGSDDIEGACLAVPYVHEYHLGIRTSDDDPTAVRNAFRASFRALYDGLVRGARERFGQLPLVATGHLTLGRGATRDDYPQAIHQVGTIEALPTDILPDDIAYVALGHIHRAYRVGGSCAWYSGTPVPYSVVESKTPRHVLVVDIGEDGGVAVEMVPVPVERRIERLVGTADEVVERLASLSWSTPSPPLLHVEVHGLEGDVGLPRRLDEALAQHPDHARPCIVEVRQIAKAEREASQDEPERKPLAALRPEEVFERLCDLEGIEGDERAVLVRAFSSLASRQSDDDGHALEAPPKAQGEEQAP